MARIANVHTTYNSEPVADAGPDYWLERLGPKRLAFEMYRAGRTEQEIIARCGPVELDMRMNAANGMAEPLGVIMLSDDAIEALAKDMPPTERETLIAHMTDEQFIEMKRREFPAKFAEIQAMTAACNNDVERLEHKLARLKKRIKAAKADRRDVIRYEKHVREAAISEGWLDG